MVRAVSRTAVSSRCWWHSGTTSSTRRVAASPEPSSTPLTAACGKRSACSTGLTYASGVSATVVLMAPACRDKREEGKKKKEEEEEDEEKKKEEEKEKKEKRS